MIEHDRASGKQRERFATLVDARLAESGEEPIPRTQRVARKDVFDRVRVLSHRPCERLSARISSRDLKPRSDSWQLTPT